MTEKVRYQLFLPKPVSDRVEVLAARPGMTKSALFTDAVTAWINRGASDELEERFGLILERMMRALARIERHGHINAETLALFVRYELAIHPPLAENDAAGRAAGADRFEEFVRRVARQIAAGRHTIVIGSDSDR